MVRIVAVHAPFRTSYREMDLSHFRIGSGPPLLLLHGLGMGHVV
jgi:hypothetical protein